MPRLIEEPVTVDIDDLRGKKTTHPAFALISASRMSGGHNVLYGSDFRHQTFIRIRVKRSELHRNLSNDWFFANEEIISVDLSEAQWATFVSSMNIGDGTPCTLTSFDGEVIPGLTLDNKTDKFRTEVAENLEEAMAELTALEAEIDALGLSKKKADGLKTHLRMARMQIKQNLPFVVEQFDEHVEQSVEKAKVNINAYMTHTMHTAGLDRLQNDNTTRPLLIDDEG